MKNWLKKLMLFRLLILDNYLKINYDAKIIKLKGNLLIIIMLNILLLNDLLS